MIFNRRFFLVGSAALSLATPSLAITKPHLDIDYLEGLPQQPSLNRNHAFIPPSQVHQAYNHVIYVDASTRGVGKQKMWVLQRRGAGWDIAMNDKEYWDQKQSKATYSWPVSTGRHYQGDNRSGPTIPGVFNLDERSARFRTGWGSPGMYKAVYIDLHYSSGRASGIAMHGTTKSMYRRLGTADSHGCIRMRQKNMDQLWNILHPNGTHGKANPLWGEIPRYFTSTATDRFNARWDYVRDGQLLYDDTGKLLTKMGYKVLLNVFRTDAA